MKLILIVTRFVPVDRNCVRIIYCHWEHHPARLISALRTIRICQEIDIFHDSAVPN